MKQESTWKLRGIFCAYSLGISWILPAEFMVIFGEFIGDETVEDFEGNP